MFDEADSAAGRLRRFAISFYGGPPDYPLEAFCALLAARGVGGIGLTPAVVASTAPAALAAMLACHGLRASSLNSAGYLLHADPARAAAQAALDEQLFAAATLLGAPVNVITGGVLDTLPGPSGADPDRLRAATRDRLAALAVRAANQGVSLSLEPMHPMALGQRSCINQIASARDAIAGLPGVGLTLDLFHSHWDVGLAALLRESPERIAVVQICGVALPPDGGPPQRARLAAGEISVASFLRALGAVPYHGMVEYEVFFEAMGRPAPERLIEEAVRDYLALSAGAADA